MRTEASVKRITHLLRPRERHWVGDGFLVSTVFSPSHLDAQLLSPFILMDHAAPRHFDPQVRRRGVGEHPHRGFETVTFAYRGEVDHRDSHGGGGTIGAGDVQWMTAASGVVHEEMHSSRFSQTGGVFEMVQLWVNLPAKLKMSSPRYQALKGASFPKLTFGEASGRLIAGHLQGKQGTARTHSPVTILDLQVPQGGEATLELPQGFTTLVFLLEGAATLQRAQEARGGALAVLDRESGSTVTVNAIEPSRVLILSGEPLAEPVVAHGPFVMNTQEEIVTAIHDYQRGAMGTLPATL